jgi:iron-sulfur cluster protein
MVEGLEKRIAIGIENKAQRKALGEGMYRSRTNRAATLLTLDDPIAFRDHVRQIKEKAIENLDALLEEFVRNATKRGAIVFIAKDGPSAIEYIASVARAKNAKLITKSKSLTSEEIEMNRPLENLGYEVVETDLGERIVQLAHEKPIHLVMPAAHKTLQQVADIFSAESGTQVAPEYDAVMGYVRKALRDSFLAADIGVTGVNIAIAETGTIVIETNEGNARLVTSTPKTHIALLGIDKIVPTIEDALYLTQAHPISSTGQKLTTYVTFISGRSPLRGTDGPRELHLVILDNGRSAMRENEAFREALYCIRCGACMNICPTYEVVGGHIFGYIYPGPIGIPWTANVHGFDKADYAPLCVACGLCREICPVDIDMPYMIARVKELHNENRGQSRVNRVVMRSDEYAKLASQFAPLSNWLLRRQPIRYLVEKSLGIDRRRRLPDFSRKTFQKWWKNHETLTSSEDKVAYFVDVYANYNRPDIGIAAVNLLERSGVEVIVPTQKTSGMPYFSYGELSKMKEIAAYNVASMLPSVKGGCEIVATEPTATHCFKEIYPKLLKSRESELVAEHTHELLEYVREKGLLDDKLSPVFSGNAGLHISCHQRALGMGRATIDLMKSIGLQVRVIETGTCCGMGGTVGLKTGVLGYELSNEVGQPLFDLFKNAKLDFGLTESSVCKIQLEEGAGLRFEHPVALLGAVLENKTGYANQLKEHLASTP